MKLSKGFILTFLSTLSWAIGIVIVRYLLKNGGNAYNIAFISTLFVAPLPGVKNSKRDLRDDDFLLYAGFGGFNGRTHFRRIFITDPNNRWSFNYSGRYFGGETKNLENMKNTVKKTQSEIILYR